MRKLLLLFAFLLQVSIIGYSQAVAPTIAKARTSKPAAIKQQAPKVYICVGAVTHTVSAVTTAEAEKKYSLKPCKKC